MDVSFEPVATSSVDRLPERLASAGTALFISDAMCALVVVAAFAVAGFGAPAFLTLAATLLIALGTGRYRWDFAASPVEEWYSAGGMALLGAMCGMLLCIPLHFEWFVSVASALIWTGLAGAAAMVMVKARRGERQYELSLDRVRECPLSTGAQVERAFIRFADLMLALSALLVLSPLFIIVAVIIAVDDGFPLLFAQKRMARDDGTFTMYKFRTMRTDAGPAWASAGDDRITRSGSFLRRTSLDELPQLWNVVRGEMSLVGPRPEMPEYAERFARDISQYSQRHIIAPGLTGWAQLRLPRNLQPSDSADVLRYDLFYVQHVGLNLYAFCLVKTACEVFTHRAV